jgi:DnaJ-class molecular chaperone
MNKNYYEILQVSENASIDDIKQSFRKLSMKYHPDKNKSPDATDKFQKISEAYETLGDVEKRAKYDMSFKNPFIKMMPMNNQMPMHNDIDDFLQNFFGMPFGHANNNSPFGPGIHVFHGGIPNNSLQKPIPIIKNINIPIEKILTGTVMPIEIERWIIENEIKVFETETIYATIPKGIDEGEIIILRDKGNILSEQLKGDIKLLVKIDNNTDFKRHGLDLIYEKNITLKEALCGFSFELKYITGKIYTINNNSGNIINHGYSKLIPNLGFTRDNHTGNLIIRFNVIFPDKLTNETIEQLKNVNF